MDVAELPQGQSKRRLFMDQHAHESSGVIVINRIKPHTDFHGLYESGLFKMCAIGLDKHAAALEIHRFGVHGLKQIMPRAGEQIFGTGKILAGIAVVENAYGQPATIRALKAD